MFHIVIESVLAALCACGFAGWIATEAATRRRIADAAMRATLAIERQYNATLIRYDEAYARAEILRRDNDRLRATLNDMRGEVAQLRLLAAPLVGGAQNKIRGLHER
jgi:hypothetical protein